MVVAPVQIWVGAQIIQGVHESVEVTGLGNQCGHKGGVCHGFESHHPDKSLKRVVTKVLSGWALDARFSWFDSNLPD